MYRYMKFTGFLNKQFEEPYTKEYNTGVAAVYNASNEEFEQLLALQNEGSEVAVEEFTELIKESEQFKHEMSKLQALFVEKTEGLKEMLADKIGMASNYIDKQSEVYEYMYQFAKDSVYDSQTNLAIITANEQSKTIAAGFVILLNNMRSKIEEMIKKGIDVDEILRKAEMIDKTTTVEQIQALF